MVEEIICRPEVLEFLRKGLARSPDFRTQRWQEIDQFGRPSGKTLSDENIRDMVENREPGWERFYRAAEKMYDRKCAQEHQ